MERKKFEIRPDPKKKFEIRSEPETGQMWGWFRQNNDSDCGPCLILNGLRRVPGARHIPSSIDDVRRDVNRLRRESGRPELRQNGWLTSEDIQGYFRDIAGLSVKEYALFQDYADKIKENIQNDLRQPFDFVYGTAGRHFRGVVRNEHGYELLDSLNEGPLPADSTTLDAFIDRAARESTPARIERIGIVRGPERQN